MRALRVVMFRNSGLTHDTRGRKIALSLAAAGYDVVFLDAVTAATAADEETPVPTLGPVAVVRVVLQTKATRVRNLRYAARRHPQIKVLDRTQRDEYVTQVAELRKAVNDLRDRRLENPNAVAPKVAHVVARARLISRRSRWRSQHFIDKVARGLWRRWDVKRLASARFATDIGNLPEIADYADSFGKVLDELEPDVLHAHHPLVLPTALRAARAPGRRAHLRGRLRRPGELRGIPAAEQGNVRRHAVLVRQEVQSIHQVAGVLPVSDPIADELQARYHLPQRPTVLLNVPPAAPLDRVASVPALRAAAGLADDVPLVVYSGGMSRARGIEVLIDAMAYLPGVHLALVTVPFPHPLTPELLARARELGVQDRIHPMPPVTQDQLIDFLAGADVAVHPLPGGTPNHDQAMPNKLFEYLHAGLPLVVSDAKLMAEFVRTNDLGEVFPTGDAAQLGAAVQKVLAADRPRVSREELMVRYSGRVRSRRCWRSTRRWRRWLTPAIRTR